MYLKIISQKEATAVYTKTTLPECPHGGPKGPMVPYGMHIIQHTQVQLNAHTNALSEPTT